METIQETAIKGGEFLIKQTKASQIFIPERFDEQQLMMAKSCQDFLDTEVWPILNRIDSGEEPELMPSLLDKAGQLGLLGTSLPEEYGGFGMSFNSAMLVADVIGAGHSFAVALSAHTGIGTLPILYYGNDAQKSKYLPKLASGEWKAAYCLTEPDSGSDANAAKTKAVLNAAGTHYALTGQKMWITNGGFADVFIVFAKLESDKNLTAFIVEKDFGNITMNPEEHKMGIKGSSTRQVFFNETLVPVENMLSTRENGFKIAVNILNIGRIKLAASAIGASKAVSNLSIKYANERKQFGLSIGKFGAIRHKLAEQAIRIFATESATYRAGQNIEDAIAALIEGGMAENQAKLKGVEEFAIECALLKVHGSETLDYVVDEGVQIYGGMGYSADAPMDRAYRDARINRIFEGTNEINRLLAVGTVLKRTFKGQLDLMGPALAVSQEIMSIPDFGTTDTTGLFAAEKVIIENLKKVILMSAGAAVQKFMDTIERQQEILMYVADMMIETYVAESVLLRAEALIEWKGEEAAELQKEMAMVYLHEAVERVAYSGKRAIAGFAESDELRVMLMGLKRFTKTEPYDTIKARQKIAQHLLNENKYAF